ncbi:hypothetical protein, partial [Caproiciproducens galactitolivorans]
VSLFVQGYFSNFAMSLMTLYMERNPYTAFFYALYRAAGVHHFMRRVFWVHRFSIFPPPDLNKRSPLFHLV